MKRLTSISILVVTSLVVTLAACGDDSQEAGGPTELVIYHTFEPDRFDPIVEPFIEYYREQTGEDITVSTVVQEAALIELEAQSGEVGADVVVISSGALIGLQEGHRIFSPLTFDDDSDEGISAAFRDIATRDGFLPIYTIPVFIAYNTEKVSPAEVPSSYEDLLNDRWKGLFGMADPEQSNVAHTSIWLLAEHLAQTEGAPYGWEYFQRLGELEPMLGAGIGPVMDMLAAGELHVAFVGMGTVISSASDGNPVAAVAPEEGVAATLTSVGVVEASEQREAAELFARWMTLAGFQEGVRDSLGYLPIRSDVAVPDFPFDMEFSSDQVISVDDHWVAGERDANIAQFADLMR